MKLLFVVTVVVLLPPVERPVTADTVPEVAQPRSVLLLVFIVVPDAVFRIPMRNAVEPVVEVNVPVFDKLAPP